MLDKLIWRRDIAWGVMRFQARAGRLVRGVDFKVTKEEIFVRVVEFNATKVQNFVRGVEKHHRQV